MAAVANFNTKRYSWWWDSHNPKNSKWLQDNLTDMDSKVKQMIKVIEEDADSFARRAEMYYKKRPELMKLVEEFYRAYRALAERYDHATGALHHAQQTMAEAFPNQDHTMMFGEEEALVGSSTEEFDPESYPHIRAPVYPSDLQKDAPSHLSTVKRNIAFMEDTQSVYNGKGLRIGNGRNSKVLSESERVSKGEAEIVALKEALSKVQAEKEASLAQFDENLERLATLESEVSRAQEDSRGFSERAARAEAEVEVLRERLSEVEAEKESTFLQYQHCLKNIADLEDEAGEVEERASQAKADKEAALVQYKQCLETISNLEERLQKAEEDARLINQRVVNADGEVESLKQKVFKLSEENEAYEVQYQQCLETIADLKLKLFHAQEETQRLSREVEDGVAKLKAAEEKCVVLERSNQSLHFELTEKQEEMGKLWTTVQEEHLRFMEAETAFQTLQQLHSQSQEELSTLALELQNRSQILKEAKEENKCLSELNLSSAASIKVLQEEVSRLREKIQELEAEVELRVDQRNALQQEIYCLKEELQEENSKLKEVKERESIEKTEKLELMVQENVLLENSISDLNAELMRLEEAFHSEKDLLQSATENSKKLSEENMLLENSLSDANAELEELKSNLKRLEDSCHLLSDDKSSLVNERESLLSHMDMMRRSVEDLEKEQAELKSKIHQLQDEYQVELDRAHDAHVEIIVLRRCLEEWVEKSSSLVAENQRIREASQLLEKLVSELEEDNIGKQVQIESSINCIKILRAGIFQVLMKLEVVPCDEKLQDQHEIVSRLDEMQTMILKIQRENQQFSIENLVLVEFIRQLRSEAVGIAAENKLLEKELESQRCQLEEEVREVGDKLRSTETENLQLKDLLGDKDILWESGASALFGDLQISVVRETLLEGLVHELAEAYKSLEERSILRDVEVEQLKGRVNNLEEANKGENELMSKYAQAIILLKESIESLESHIDMPHEFENGPAKDTASMVDNNEGVLELQEMCLRIKAIEETVTEKLAVQELKPASRRGTLMKQNNETYPEESEMITKDILLDQVSDCSSYGISKRDKTEDEVKPQHPQKGKSMSEESLLVVDKLEVSDTDPNKRKVLERLDSDLQKLSNLHNVVEDLKSKVEREERQDEYETVKGQISEAEEALERLLSINKKLVTKVVSKSSMDLDEDESSRRRRVAEQARRGSEKIGRLQLEIERLEFLLLKLEGEREDRVKAKVADGKRRTLLKDYIYGGVRGERRKRMKKRFAFCGCVQQPPPSP